VNGKARIHLPTTHEPRHEKWEELVASVVESW